MAVCIIILLFIYSQNAYCAANQTTLGQKWIKNTSIGTKDLFRIAYGNGTFVAVGKEGEIQFSKNGTLLKKSDSKTSENLSQILWTGSKFVTFYSKVKNSDADSNELFPADSYLAYSQDGKTWTKKLIKPDAIIHNIEYNGKQFTALSTNFKENNCNVLISNDAINWNCYGEIADAFFRAMDGNENVLVIAGYDTTLIYSK